MFLYFKKIRFKFQQINGCFTGNNLIIMAWASHKVSTWQLLRNWIIVYAGNFVGAVLTAFMIFLSEIYLIGNGSQGLTALNIANAKVGLDFLPALVRGIFCNVLVCGSLVVYERPQR